MLLCERYCPCSSDEKCHVKDDELLKRNKISDITRRFEFLGNSLTQTNQTKQKFNRLYDLDYWIQIVQFHEQQKS